MSNFDKAIRENLLEQIVEQYIAIRARSRRRIIVQHHKSQMSCIFIQMPIVHYLFPLRDGLLNSSGVCTHSMSSASFQKNRFAASVAHNKERRVNRFFLPCFIKGNYGVLSIPFHLKARSEPSAVFGGLLDGKIKNKIETKFGKCDRETIELAKKSNDSIALLLGSMYFWSWLIQLNRS